MRVVNQDTAAFEVGELKFTVERTKVTWGQNRAVALPDGWKRVELIDHGMYVEVQVDGRTLGEIRPGA